MQHDLPVKRRTLFAAAAGLTVSALGLAHVARAATRGGKIRFGRQEDCKNLDPAMSELNADIWVMTNLLGMLIEPGPDGKLHPGLATKWDWSDGGKTLTIQLRENVRFANGDAFSADDVKFTLERVAGLKDGAWSAQVESIDHVDVISPTQVALRLKHPDPAMLAVLGMFVTCIMPKAHVLSLPGANVEEKIKAFINKPVGTGPFLMTEWKRDDVMHTVRNPHYWKMGDDGKPLPYADEVEYQILKDDNTRLLKLKSGELDGAELIPYSRVAELKADANLRVELWPSTKTVIAIMNQRPALKDGSKNPLADLRVRQALNYAVNKQAVIQITTHGLGKPMGSYLSSATPLYYGPEPLYPYNLDKAKALLKEAGYAGGMELSVMSLAGNQDEITNFTAIQQMWGQIGVKLKIEQIEMATRLARFKAGDFQIRGFYWTDDISDPSEATGYYVYPPVNGALHSGWSDDKANKLFEQSQQEIDPEKRADEYKQIQEIYNGAAPIIYLYEVPYAVAFRKNVKGFVQLPLGNNIFEAASVEKA